MKFYCLVLNNCLIIVVHCCALKCLESDKLTKISYEKNLLSSVALFVAMIFTQATAKFFGGQGEIRVEGVAGQFAVYSYSGALVATGSEAVSVPTGMYIVLVDGVATKVVVR